MRHTLRGYLLNTIEDLLRIGLYSRLSSVHMLARVGISRAANELVELSPNGVAKNLVLRGIS
jgi:hypothetical protein